MLDDVFEQAENNGVFSLAKTDAKSVINQVRNDYPQITSSTKNLVWSQQRLSDLIRRERQSDLTRGVKTFMDNMHSMFGADTPDLSEIMDYQVRYVSELNVMLKLIGKQNLLVLGNLDKERNSLSRKVGAEVIGLEEIEDDYKNSKNEYTELKLTFETLTPRDCYYFAVERKMFTAENEVEKYKFRYLQAMEAIKDNTAAKDLLTQQRRMLWLRHTYCVSIDAAVSRMLSYLRTAQPVFELFLRQQETLHNLQNACENTAAFLGTLQDLVCSGAEETSGMFAKPANLHQLFNDLSTKTQDYVDTEDKLYSKHASETATSVGNYLDTGDKRCLL
ncbi:hypothetical protein ACFL96_10890 [Thermoproteota archaeon]